MGSGGLGSIGGHKYGYGAGEHAVGVFRWHVPVELTEQPHLEEGAGRKFYELARCKVHIISNQRSLIDMMLKKITQHNSDIVRCRHEKPLRKLGHTVDNAKH